MFNAIMVISLFLFCKQCFPTIIIHFIKQLKEEVKKQDFLNIYSSVCFCVFESSRYISQGVHKYFVPLFDINHM